MASNLLQQFQGVNSIVQNGVLEQAFHDQLFPKLLFRNEAEAEELKGQIGVTLTFTRPGPLPAITKPFSGSGDAVPQATSYEQWSITAQRYKAGKVTQMAASRAAQESLLLDDIKLLGEQAGLSMNRAVRDRLYLAALSGSTAATGVNAAAVIPVAALAGFRFTLNADGGLVPVSASFPIAATIIHGGAPVVVSVIGATPTDATFPDGPGTITLSATQAASARDAITAATATYQRIVGATALAPYIDGLTAGNVATLQDFLTVVAALRRNNVPTFEDGTYHVHLDTQHELELFGDAAFRQINTALPDGMRYREFALGKLGGMTFFRNTETPTSQTVQTTGKTFVGELVNSTSIPMYRSIILGRNSIREWYIPWEDYVTEAGITGKSGDFKVTNEGVQIITDRSKLILRAPLNDTQDEITSTWVNDVDWALPSDFTSGSAAQFKRVGCVVSA